MTNPMPGLRHDRVVRDLSDTAPLGYLDDEGELMTLTRFLHHLEDHDVPFSAMPYIETMGNDYWFETGEQRRRINRARWEDGL